MARTQNTLIGRASGSVGGVTFSTWKGINVIKQKPETVANPQTDGQTQQRSGMAQMVAIFRAISAVVDNGFKKLAVKMSAYNAFISANLVSAFDYTVAGVATFVPTDLLTSKGTITPQPITLVACNRSLNTIRVEWDSTVLQVGQSATDNSTIAAYNITKDEWVGYGIVNDRGNNTNNANQPLPAGWAIGDSVQVYLGFFNPTSQDAGDSVNDNTAIVT